MLDNLEGQLKNKIEEVTRDFNADLVEFKLLAYGTKYTLHCLVDYPSGGITLGDCAMINGRICAFLEESKLLGDDYTVTVNSPGLDRPLKTYKDFLRTQGRDLCIWLSSPVEGKEYIEGTLTDLTPEFLFLKYKDRVYKIKFPSIKLGKEKVGI